MISFEEFCNNLGLVEYPFSQYATENELAIRSKLFYPPSDYAIIVTAFNSGQSFFIIGNRGTGKTAILYDLSDRAKQHDRLYAVLDDFSRMSAPVRETEFYGAILRKLTEALAYALIRERYRINRLDHRERMLLTYLFHKYLPSVSRAEVVRAIELIQYKN